MISLCYLSWLFGRKCFCLYFHWLHPSSTLSNCTMTIMMRREQMTYHLSFWYVHQLLKQLLICSFDLNVLIYICKPLMRGTYQFPWTHVTWVYCWYVDLTSAPVLHPLDHVSRSFSFPVPPWSALIYANDAHSSYKSCKSIVVLEAIQGICYIFVYKARTYHFNSQTYNLFYRFNIPYTF